MTIHAHASNLLSFDHWLKEIGKTPATGWRWRQRGWIKTVNIAGRVYVHREEIATFEARAAAGDFSQTPKSPSRKVEHHERDEYY